MSVLETLKILAVNVFPTASYEPLKWQIWKCELGWFLLVRSHMVWSNICIREITDELELVKFYHSKFPSNVVT